MSADTVERLLAENEALEEWGKALKDLISFYAAALVRVDELLQERGLEIDISEAAGRKQAELRARVETAALAVKAHREAQQ